MDPLGVLSINAHVLAHSLFLCLGYLRWAKGQLQQLLPPGDAAKAAAALRDLQEQQQHLQQALTLAVWRLNRAAALFLAAVYQHSEQALPAQQHSSSSSDKGAHAPMQVTPADIAAIASSHPEGTLLLQDLDPTLLPIQYQEAAETAAALVGPVLPAQLQAFAGALWSALPQPRCCNNAACANLGGVSEAKLVAGKTSRCSKCKVAK
jgi:hypothetical protein